MSTARFLTDAVIRPIPKPERRRRGFSERTQLWEVMQPLVYRSVVARATFTGPAGFVTDLGSVPRAPIAFLLTGDVAHEEAIIHDLLYQTHLVETQALADAVFEEAMIVTEVSAWQRWMIVKAVEMFGRSSWESGPSRLRVLNRENALPKIAEGGRVAFQMAGLVEFAPASALA